MSTMPPILERCISTICRERDIGFDASHQVVAELVQECDSPSFADYVFDSVPRTIPFEIVADLLSLALWATPDNGSSIMRAVEGWLTRPTDTRKLLVALNLEFIPFSSFQEAKQVLSRIPDEHALARMHVHRVLDYWEKHS
jgi:hypothetical protein